MKKYIALLACFIASSATAQIVTYQVRGVVTSLLNAPGFAIGGSYTLKFSLNESFMFAPDLGSATQFGSPATSLAFDYENGVYVGTMDAARVSAWNGPVDNGGDIFSMGTPFVGPSFPPMLGSPLLSISPDTSNAGFSIFDLYDRTGAALTAKSHIDLSKISRFTSSDDHLSLIWGTFNPDLPWSVVNASIDSIEKIGPPLSPVPEPSTYGLMGSLALFGLAVRRIKRKRQAQAA